MPPPEDAPQLLPGTLFLLVLRTLAGGPLHGYAIARRIKDASASGLVIEDGSLYPAWNRILVKGREPAEWGPSCSSVLGASAGNCWEGALLRRVPHGEGVRNSVGPRAHSRILEGFGNFGGPKPGPALSAGASGPPVEAPDFR